MIFEKAITPEEMRGAISEVFSTDAGKVQVLRDLADALEGFEVTALIRELGGEFKTCVSIFFEGRADSRESYEPVSQLCFLLNSRALISDDSKDPYTWLLISGTCRPAPVAVKVDDLDNDEFNLDEDYIPPPVNAKPI